MSLKFCCALLLFMIGVASARASSPSETDPLRPAVISEPAAEAFAQEFVLHRSTAELYAVFESTSPEYNAAVYLRRGVYRRELLILFGMAKDSETSLGELVREREKGVNLQTLAVKTGADLMKLFREAAALQGEIEGGMKDAATAAVESSSIAAQGGAVGAETSAPAGGDGHGR